MEDATGPMIFDDSDDVDESTDKPAEENITSVEQKTDEDDKEMLERKSKELADEPNTVWMVGTTSSMIFGNNDDKSIGKPLGRDVISVDQKTDKDDKGMLERQSNKLADEPNIVWMKGTTSSMIFGNNDDKSIGKPLGRDVISVDQKTGKDDKGLPQRKSYELTDELSSAWMEDNTGPMIFDDSDDVDESTDKPAEENITSVEQKTDEDGKEMLERRNKELADEQSPAWIGYMTNPVALDENASAVSNQNDRQSKIQLAQDVNSAVEIPKNLDDGPDNAKASEAQTDPTKHEADEGALDEREVAEQRNQIEDESQRRQIPIAKVGNNESAKKRAQGDEAPCSDSGEDTFSEGIFGSSKGRRRLEATTATSHPTADLPSSNASSPDESQGGTGPESYRLSSLKPPAAPPESLSSSSHDRVGRRRRKRRQQARSSSSETDSHVQHHDQRDHADLKLSRPPPAIKEASKLVYLETASDSLAEEMATGFVDEESEPLLADAEDDDDVHNNEGDDFSSARMLPMREFGSTPAKSESELRVAETQGQSKQVHSAAAATETAVIALTEGDHLLEGPRDDDDAVEQRKAAGGDVRGDAANTALRSDIGSEGMEQHVAGDAMTKDAATTPVRSEAEKHLGRQEASEVAVVEHVGVPMGGQRDDSAVPQDVNEVSTLRDRTTWMRALKYQARERDWPAFNNLRKAERSFYLEYKKLRPSSYSPKVEKGRNISLPRRKALADAKDVVGAQVDDKVGVSGPVSPVPDLIASCSEREGPNDQMWNASNPSYVKTRNAVEDQKSKHHQDASEVKAKKVADSKGESLRRDDREALKPGERASRAPGGDATSQDAVEAQKIERTVREGDQALPALPDAAPDVLGNKKERPDRKSDNKDLVEVMSSPSTQIKAAIIDDRNFQDKRDEGTSTLNPVEEAKINTDEDFQIQASCPSAADAAESDKEPPDKMRCDISKLLVGDGDSWTNRSECYEAEIRLAKLGLLRLKKAEASFQELELLWNKKEDFPTTGHLVSHVEALVTYLSACLKDVLVDLTSQGSNLTASQARTKMIGRMKKEVRVSQVRLNFFFSQQTRMTPVLNSFRLCWARTFWLSHISVR